jgi:hypothetical protein
LAGTNAQAYHEKSQLTAVKSFITLTTEVYQFYACGVNGEASVNVKNEYFYYFSLPSLNPPNSTWSKLSDVTLLLN